MSQLSKCMPHEPNRGRRSRPAVVTPQAVGSVRFEGLSCRFDDLSQPAIRPAGRDPTITVGALLLKHAEADELAKLLSCVSWPDHFAWRLRLKEPWLVTARDPQSQLQAAWAPKEQLATLDPESTRTGSAPARATDRTRRTC
jgi:hypothetical protein